VEKKSSSYLNLRPETRQNIEFFSEARSGCKSYRSIFLSPIEVIRPCGSSVLIDQLLNHVPRIVQLIQIVFEHRLLPELLQEGLSLAQFVVLIQTPLEQLQATTVERFFNAKPNQLTEEMLVWLASIKPETL
jgi:hypothetical protein